MINNHEKKFEEAILYIAKKSEMDEKYGSVKLNKLLFCSDFIAFAQFGQPITNQEYQKLEKGPAPRRIIPVIDAMESKGDCAYQERIYYGHPQKRLLALREPKLSCFSGDEIALIDQIINRYWGLNATNVSDKSHLFLGYDIVDMGETIPYETVFVSNRSLSIEEKKYALKLK